MNIVLSLNLKVQILDHSPKKKVQEYSLPQTKLVLLKIFNFTYFIDSKFVNKRDILKLRIIITTEGTASVLYTMGFKNKTFTHIFIDEAGQSMEPELLLPLCMNCLFLNET